MFKSKKSRIILTSVVIVLILGCTVFARQISETAEIFYNDIKIYIDGAEIVPKDVNGNIVEPFVMNGTTYLPVRAISNAFGQDVEWDGETQSVYIGKKDQTKPDNYLDRIQYNYYKAGNNASSFYKINGTVTDFMSTTYTNGILLNVYVNDSYKIQSDKDDAYILIDYPLNSQYKKLNGKIVLPQNIKIAALNNNTEFSQTNNFPVDVFFYGDDKLLYKATHVTDTMPFDFNIDLNGVNKLTVKVTADGGPYFTYVAITDLSLYK